MKQCNWLRPHKWYIIEGFSGVDSITPTKWQCERCQCIKNTDGTIETEEEHHRRLSKERNKFRMAPPRYDGFNSAYPYSSSCYVTWTTANPW